MINYIHGENFLPYRTMYHVFPQRGLVHIDGVIEDNPGATSNGSGKTSILSFLKWVWFGITDRGGVDSVINAKAKKDCFGEVSSQNGGREVIVKRYRKHKEFGNSKFLFIDGVQVFDDDLQARIDDALGFDAEVFMRAFVFDNKLAVARMKDTEAKDFFEKLLGADFSTWSDAAKRYRDKSVASFEEVKTVHTQLTTDLTVAEGSRDEVHSAIGTWDDEHRQRLDYASLALQEARETEEGARLAHSALEASTADNSIALTSSKADVESCRQQTHRLNASIQANRKLAARLTVQANRPIDPASLACPTCNRPWGDVERDEATRKYKSSVSELRAEVVGLEQAVRGETNEHTQFIRQLKISMDQVERLEQEYNVVLEAKRNLDVACRRSTDCSNSLASVTVQSNPHDARSAELQARCASLTVAIEEKKQFVEQWETYLEGVQFIVDMFSKTGLRSYLLDLVVPFVNARLSYYLQFLTGGDITAEVRTTTKTGREKFHIAVNKKDGGDTYESLSEGQAARVNICLILALHDNIKRYIPTKILVFDELFDKMDAAGIERVVEILRGISQDTLVLVIAHNPYLSTYANDVITVKMANNEATIT